MMNESQSGRAAGLFAAVLGVSAALGLSLFWLSGRSSAEPSAEEAVAEPVKADAAKSETPAPEQTQVAKAPKRKVKVTWEGGGSDNDSSRKRYYVGPARPYYTGGAVNQPGPNPRFPQFKTTREQLPNGKVRITLYRTN
jgi:hypothetical protein